MENEKKSFTSNLSANLWLILIILFFYLPIIYVVIFSFNSTKSLTVFSGFSTQWYQKMFSDRTMLEPIYYTILVAVIATIVSTVIGTITSIGLSKQKKLVRELVLQVNNLPVMNPDIVTAIGLMLFFLSVNIETSFWTLLLSHITFCIPYVVLAIMPKLRTLDDNVAEAALDLGATPFQALTKVIIPQIMPAIMSGALMAFSMSFDDFVISFFTTGTGVSNISIYVYSMSKRINPSINALSSIIVAVITTVLVLVNVIPLIKSKKPVEKDINKKKGSFIPAVVATLAVIIVLVSLGFKSTGDFDPIAEFGSDTLNVFNSGEYIGEDVISNFEKKYNVRVNYDTFTTQEEMYTKLMGGSSYDIIVPSDYMIERLLKSDMLQKIDKSIVQSLDTLNPGLIEYMSFDPNMDYSVPYFWGSLGIVYDCTQVEQQEVEKYGWELFRQEKYSGNAFMYDSEREAFCIAFKSLGYSMNTSDDKEISEAYDWLVDMDKKLNPSYVTDEVIDDMCNGAKAFALVFSGDAAYILSENENMRYYEPQQGTNIWIDAMCIPSNAKNTKLANVFIEYILSYDVSYANSEYVGYTSPNLEVAEVLSGEEGEYFENSAYTPRTGYSLDETFVDNESQRKKISELWVKVKLN
ncbi:MAG: extracellular solute-binding protein [Erysipelotrichia bacterium]|nr:extracellular solute-binding protein [Erysipelotrichia bacterium]